MIQALIWSEDALNWLLSVGAFIFDVYYAGGFRFGISILSYVVTGDIEPPFFKSKYYHMILSMKLYIMQHPIVWRLNFHKILFSTYKCQVYEFTNSQYCNPKVHLFENIVKFVILRQHNFNLC